MMRKIAYDWGMGKTFRENLREELDYKGISVKQLSDMTGISKRTLENYLGNKETIPPADYACKIAAVLNVTVEYLVNGYKAPTVELEKYDFKTLFQDLIKLDDNSRAVIKAMIHSFAGKPQ